MKKSTAAKTAAIASAALMGAGLLLAPPAMAYPAGQETEPVVGREVVNPRGSTAAGAVNVDPVCLVAVRVFNPNGRRTSTQKRLVPDSNFRVLTRAQMGTRSGFWTIRTTIYGNNCPDDARGVFETQVRVR